MKNLDFDAFGEPMELHATTPGQAGRWLLRVGTATFWALVAVIVAARAVYFVDYSFDLEKIAAFMRALFIWS